MVKRGASYVRVAALNYRLRLWLSVVLHCFVIYLSTLRIEAMTLDYTILYCSKYLHWSFRRYTAI